MTRKVILILAVASIPFILGAGVDARPRFDSPLAPPGGARSARAGPASGVAPTPTAAPALATPIPMATPLPPPEAGDKAEPRPTLSPSPTPPAALLPETGAELR